MLVLTRKSCESVVIGGALNVQPMLKVTVLEIRGGKVKLGFEADPSIPIQRSEVRERIRAAELPDVPTEDFNELTVR
jgi:carbon storage regulator CsrA